MQTVKNAIKISMENKRLLVNRKKKYKVKSIDAAISVLFEKEKELTSLKRPQRKKIQNVPIVIEKQTEIQQDVCPYCLKFVKCINKWIRHPEEVKAHRCFVARNQCVFRTEGNDGKVDCAKDYARTGKIQKLTKEACDDCWNGKIEIFHNFLKEPEATIIQGK